ncbi:MAG: hypothetical protein KC657_35900 [Myxococcales bacterium]|nr:hypothetical protein [Myxococcales bacterium]
MTRDDRRKPGGPKTHTSPARGGPSARGPRPDRARPPDRSGAPTLGARPDRGGPRHGTATARPAVHKRPDKPALRLQPTTLWDYPSQHYGEGMQGDARYVGATPSYVIWNLIERYTKPDDLVIDPFCGSGTTLDVAKDTGRRARGFDVAPSRPDIEKADARSLPVGKGEAALVFMDPPYGDHIDYSDDPRCIGKLSAYTHEYYRAMQRAFREATRVLRPGGVLGVYVCDAYDKKRGFAPIGLQLLGGISESLRILDVCAVVRHNKTLEMGNYRRAAEEGNFFLRGFNYLIIADKPAPRGGRDA